MIPSSAKRALRFLHPDFEVAPSPAGFTVASDGRLELASADESVRQSLLLLITTAPGERLMRPDYGCALHRLIFAPNDATTAGEAIHYVRQAVARFEPRAKILDLDAGPAPDDPRVLEVRLQYRVRSTGSEASLALRLDLGGSA